jgi:hypothetical protein
MIEFPNTKKTSGICHETLVSATPRNSSLIKISGYVCLLGLLAATNLTSASELNELPHHSKELPLIEGMENFKIRFIRLEHDGNGWDDGMRATKADINLLQHFAKSTGVKQVARRGESHKIGLLAKYPRDGFPPFVFLTGNHQIGRVSQKDMKILREYCQGGGMLIADAGSPQFHQSFLRFMKDVFPEKSLMDIPDDDTLYQKPFPFPKGAPAFWNHGGNIPLGIKHEGRWVVFYHPGDMNDAWKSESHTDVTPELKEAALNLGVNLLLYSFESWNEAVAKSEN